MLVIPYDSLEHLLLIKNDRIYFVLTPVVHIDLQYSIGSYSYDF